MHHDIQVYTSALAQDFSNQLLMQQEHMHMLLERSLGQMHAAYSAELSRLSMECVRNKSEVMNSFTKMITIAMSRRLKSFVAAFMN